MLVHESPEGLVAGRIVEVEAYEGNDDPASHARPNDSQSVMFGPPGHAHLFHLRHASLPEPGGSA
jgi:DNA-3-methyladenine glycosylase